MHGEWILPSGERWPIVFDDGSIYERDYWLLRSAGIDRDTVVRAFEQEGIDANSYEYRNHRRRL